MLNKFFRLSIKPLSIYFLAATVAWTVNLQAAETETETETETEIIIKKVEQEEIEVETETGWWVSVEGGYAWSVRDSKTQVKNMPEVSLPDDYVTKSRGDSGLVGATVGYQFGCFMGCEHSLFPNTRLGFGYEFLAESTIDGDIRQYQEQTNYTYKYDTYSSVLWGDGQFDLFNWNNFTPFIDVALGIAFNTAKNYTESRVSERVFPRPSADFANHTTTSFAWRAGLGLNYSMPQYDEWTAGILVRYSDLGEVKTGDSETYPTLEHLNLPIDNIEMLLQLRYNF